MGRLLLLAASAVCAGCAALPAPAAAQCRLCTQSSTSPLSGAENDDIQLEVETNLSFRIGGRLLLSGSADGQFRGDLPVTVEYQ